MATVCDACKYGRCEQCTEADHDPVTRMEGYLGVCGCDRRAGAHVVTWNDLRAIRKHDEDLAYERAMGDDL